MLVAVREGRGRVPGRDGPELLGRHRGMDRDAGGGPRHHRARRPGPTPGGREHRGAGDRAAVVLPSLEDAVGCRRIPGAAERSSTTARRFGAILAPGTWNWFPLTSSASTSSSYTVPRSRNSARHAEALHVRRHVHVVGGPGESVGIVVDLFRDDDLVAGDVHRRSNHGLRDVIPSRSPGPRRDTGFLLAPFGSSASAGNIDLRRRGHIVREGGAPDQDLPVERLAPARVYSPFGERCLAGRRTRTPRSGGSLDSKKIPAIVRSQQLPLRSDDQHRPSVGVEHAQRLPSVVVERAMNAQVAVGEVVLDDELRGRDLGGAA